MRYAIFWDFTQRFHLKMGPGRLSRNVGEFVPKRRQDNKLKLRKIPEKTQISFTPQRMPEMILLKSFTQQLV